MNDSIAVRELEKIHTYCFGGVSVSVRQTASRLEVRLYLYRPRHLFASTSSSIRIDFVFHSGQFCQDHTSQFWVFNRYLLIVEKVTVENNITQNNKMMTLANKYDKKNRHNLQSFSRTCTTKNEEKLHVEYRPKHEKK